LNTGQLPFADYYGLLGFHVFAAAFALLGEYNALFVAQWFCIYLVINGTMAFFLLVYRLFDNPQWGILGAILGLATPLGFLYGTNEFWPNALALPFALYCMYFLFDANLRTNFSQAEKKWYIFLGILLPIVLCMIHNVIFVTFWGAAVFFQLMFRKSKRIQIASLICLGIGMAYFLLYNYLFYNSILISNPQILFSLPWWMYIFVPPAIYIGYKVLKKMVDVPPGSFEDLLHNKATDAGVIQFLEKKHKYFILFLCVGVPIAIEAILTSGFNGTSLDFVVGTIDMLFIIAFIEIAVLGLLIIRRKENWGRAIFYWGIFFTLGFAVYSLYDYFYSHQDLINRMLMFSTPALLVLAAVYFYRVINSVPSHGERANKYILLIVVASLVFNMIGDSQVQGVTTYDATSASYLGSATVPNSVFVAAFLWDYPINFYSANETNTNYNYSYYLFPQNETTQQNFFSTLKAENTGAVFAVLDSSYLVRGIASLGLPPFGLMTQNEVNQYQNLTYFDHIYSSCMDPQNWVMVFSFD
jgi:hypothetical protein